MRRSFSVSVKVECRSFCVVNGRVYLSLFVPVKVYVGLRFVSKGKTTKLAKLACLSVSDIPFVRWFDNTPRNLTGDKSCGSCAVFPMAESHQTIKVGRSSYCIVL